MCYRAQEMKKFIYAIAVVCVFVLFAWYFLDPSRYDARMIDSRGLWEVRRR